MPALNPEQIKHHAPIHSDELELVTSPDIDPDERLNAAKAALDANRREAAKLHLLIAALEEAKVHRERKTTA